MYLQEGTSQAFIPRNVQPTPHLSDPSTIPDTPYNTPPIPLCNFCWQQRLQVQSTASLEVITPSHTSQNPKFQTPRPTQALNLKRKRATPKPAAFSPRPALLRVCLGCMLQDCFHTKRPPNTVVFAANSILQVFGVNFAGNPSTETLQPYVFLRV